MLVRIVVVLMDASDGWLLKGDDGRVLLAVLLTVVSRLERAVFTVEFSAVLCPVL